MKKTSAMKSASWESERSDRTGNYSSSDHSPNPNQHVQEPELAQSYHPTGDASAASKPKRMSISLTAKESGKLDWLAESQEITQNEALRKAIATEYWIQQAIQDGKRIIIADPDGKPEMEVVFR